MSNRNNELKNLGYKQELHRSLGVWQLTAYGLNYMIPIAPAIIFGFILTTSGGTVALPYLFALCGTFFTAIGYAYFIRRYPLSGSVYNYVSKSIGIETGFIAGWSILLDYMVVPTLTAMSASAFLHDLTHIPYEPILLLFILSTGLLNLIGSSPLAKLGLIMLIIGEIVIFTGFAVWGYSIQINHVGSGTLISMAPFHFTSFESLTAATSIAMLSYLGFDAITTLAEEAKNPKKDIPKAIFLSLIIGSITMFLTGYIGTLVVPNWHTYIHDQNWINTTLFFVSKKTGGEPLVLFYTIGFVLAMGIFNVVATTGASRILYSISRDGILPFSCLKYISKKTKVPTYGILLVISIQLIIGSTCGIELIAKIVNFGALLGFCLLNVGFFVHIISKKQNSKFLLTVPILGIIINAWIFLHLGREAILMGGAWLFVGFLLYIFKKTTLLKANGS